MIRVSDAAQGVRTGPVARVLAAGLTRRPVQAIVTGLVLLITASASVLAAALLVDSRGPFDHVFAAQVTAYLQIMVSLGVIGLGLSLLIVASVVSRTAVADRTRIRILKSIGFGPGQVTAVYAGQSLVPAAVGCLGGVAVANVLARPLLASAAHSSGLLSVPAWVDVDVAVAIWGLTGIAALLPALRSARPSAAPPTASALRTERSLP